MSIGVQREESVIDSPPQALQGYGAERGRKRAPYICEHLPAKLVERRHRERGRDGSVDEREAYAVHDNLVSVNVGRRFEPARGGHRRQLLRGRVEIRRVRVERVPAVAFDSHPSDEQTVLVEGHAPGVGREAEREFGVDVAAWQLRKLDSEERASGRECKNLLLNIGAGF